MTTYRILAMNTQLRPAVVTDDSHIYNMDDKRRAGFIADRVLSDDYDIVAFSEVFDEGARQVLLDRMSARYPFRVPSFGKGIVSSGVVNLEQDSGLMLLSKFRLLPVAIPEGFASESELDAPGGKSLAAFHRYREGFSADALAQKGIGFVRLDNPRSGRPLNLFLTHLQADVVGREEDSLRERAGHVAEALAFIKRWAPAGQGHDDMLVGDLNIKGARDAEENGPAFAEYRQHIAQGGFALEGFRDVHRLAADPSDPMPSFDGIRNSANRGSSQQRLDYILLRSADATMAVQHTTLRRRYVIATQPGPGYIATDLSDHYGLDATIGRARENVNPRLARSVPAAGDSFTADFGGDGGTCHWYRIEEPGTHSVQITAGPVIKVQAFAATDLSEPLDSTALAPFGTLRMVLRLDEPSLLELRPDSANRAGAYTVAFRRHRGATVDDTIALLPVTPMRVPEGVRRALFALQLNPLESGKPLGLNFHTDRHAGVAVRLRLLDASGAPIAGLNSTTQEGQAHLSVSSGSSPITPSTRKILLEVDGGQAVLPAGMRVWWTSSYRRLRLRELRVLTSADGVTDHDDEVTLNIKVDGGPVRSFNLGKIHQNSFKKLPPELARIGFAGAVELRAVDADAGTSGRDDASIVHAIDRTLDDNLPIIMPIKKGGTGGKVGEYRILASVTAH